jgi:hypothetical protein
MNKSIGETEKYPGGVFMGHFQCDRPRIQQSPAGNGGALGMVCLLFAYSIVGGNQAAFEAGSTVGSGAGPQIYAEKTVGCSSRFPFDMMIPSGSVWSAD